MGQGDPISALLYCLVNKIRVILQSAGLTDTPGGPLSNLGWIDDSSWIGTSHSDIQRVASCLPMAGSSQISFRIPQKPSGSALLCGASESPLAINPSTSRVCHCAYGKRGSTFGSWAGTPCPMSSTVASCRRAVAPVSMGTLPAHYPIHMYNAVAGGIRRWSSALRPPLPRAMQLANLPVASAGWGSSIGASPWT